MGLSTMSSPLPIISPITPIHPQVSGHHDTIIKVDVIIFQLTLRMCAVFECSKPDFISVGN